MKSIDKYVLVLVASLALLLAGCGGGSTIDKTPPPDPGPTPVQTAQANLKTAEDGLAAATTDAAMLAAYKAVKTAADALVAAQKAAGEDTTAAATRSGEAMAKVDELTRKIAAADKKAADDAAKAMAALTAKLWNGMGTAPLAHNNATGTNISDTAVLSVQRETGDTDPPAVTLTKDDDATVAALHSWTGSEHNGKPTQATIDANTDSGTYMARMYANVGKATEGPKFNSGSGSNNVGFDLDADGKTLSGDNFSGTNSVRVASPSFTHSSGTRNLKTTDKNPDGTAKDETFFSGSYYGVSGVYKCAHTSTQNCTVTKEAKGYSLGSGTWTFVATDPTAKVTETADDSYAVYGWWLHEDGDGKATVSAFHDHRKKPADAISISGLEGSATYKGGAAGKYAIDGGVNDAGDFTADVELTATFNGSDPHSIKGAISNFMGGDGKARDWAVALKKSVLGNSGEITAGTATTAWTMGGEAAKASGSWSGELYELEGGTPSVGTGVFHSVYTNAYRDTGRMVGAFGVNCTTCGK